MAENKPKNEIPDCIIENQENEYITKHYTEINGINVKIRKNKNCNIYILDKSSGMFVDECENCKIIIGPIEGYIMVRNSKNCKISVIARQVRLKECENIKCFIYCPSEPAIENSFNIYFAPYNSFFPHLKELFQKSGFIKDKNNINNPYDFTPETNLGNNSPHFLKLPDNEFNIEKIADYNKPIEEMWNGYSESEELIKGKINFATKSNIEDNQNDEKRKKMLTKILLISCGIVILSIAIIKMTKK